MLKIIIKGQCFMKKIKRIFTTLYKTRQLLGNKGSEDEDCHPSSQKNIESKLKLKKLCKKILSQLKLLVDQHSSSVFSKFSTEKDALAFLRNKLEGSKTFTVDGKKVCLSSK